MAWLPFARAAGVVLALAAGTAGCGGPPEQPAAASSCPSTAAASTVSPSPCSTIMATEATSPAGPVAQKWQGTVRAKLTDASPAGTCVGTYRADIVLSVPPGGPASGEGTVTDAPVNSCGKTTFAIVGQALHVTATVQDYAFAFDSTQFSPGTGPVVVKMADTGHVRASGSGTVHRSAAGQTVLTTVLTFDLSCTNCG
jgi:hypothetical protein